MLSPTVFYRWQKMFFGNGAADFERPETSLTSDLLCGRKEECGESSGGCLTQRGSVAPHLLEVGYDVRAVWELLRHKDG